MPSKIRYRLANALSNAPGVGNPLWYKAIDRGYSAYEEEWREQGLDEADIRIRRASIEDRVDIWVNHDTYDPNEGIPLDILTRLCHKVEQWATVQMAMTGDSHYAMAADSASQVAEAVKALAIDRVPRLHLSQILDSVLAEGVRLPELGQEASVWHVVTHPGQIYKPADTVLWWGFCDSGLRSARKEWTSKELSWLKDSGITVPHESLFRRREAAAWNRAVSMAKRQLILFAPGAIRGKEVGVHPFWDEVKYAVAPTTEVERRITYDASRLRKEPISQLTGATIERVQLEKRATPLPIRDWSAPKSTLTPRRTESATSFEMLLGCPLSWTLRYPAQVHSGRALSLPGEPIMLGLLAHEVLRHLLSESREWKPEAAKGRIGDLYVELVQTFAAPLLEPQNGVLRGETKRRLQNAIGNFFTIINQAGIHIESTEHELHRSWSEGVDVEGRLDLIAKTTSGAPMVIDAKWTKRPKRYRERLEGLSTQLTLYHWLLAGDTETELPIAYFMLRSGDLYAHPYSDIPSQYYVTGLDYVQSLEILRTGLDAAWRKLDEGKVVAAGLPHDSEGDKPLVEPPCRYCEFKNLCGREEVAE